MSDFSRSHIYHNWETLVRGAVKKHEDRQLCYAYSSSSLDSTSTSNISRRHSFNLQNDQSNEHAQQLLPHNIISPASLKPPKVLSGSTIGKIVGATRQFITPATKLPQSQWKKLPQESVSVNGLQGSSEFSTPTELIVQWLNTTTEAYDLSLGELKEKTDNFGSKALIGQGCYGRVYFAQLDSGKCVAVKKLNVPCSDSNPIDEFVMQASVLSRLNQENLMGLLGYWIDGSICILAYEYATMGSLHDILHRTEISVPDWNQRVFFAIDAARGLEYLHDHSILHREIRSSNVLLFNYHEPKAKIADFGFSNQTPTPHLNSFQFLQTFGYPPEFTMDEKWTMKSDVYCFGVVLLELLTGREAVNLKREYGERSLVCWATPKLGVYTVEQIVDPRLGKQYPLKAAAKLAGIAASCVQYEAEFRPNMSIVVKDLQSLLPLVL